MFSKACEYGIRAAIYIAHQSKLQVRVGLKDISREIDSPEAFTAKILQQLVKHDIITSVKGPAGGFEMNRESIDQINLYHIVCAIDGDQILHGCALGLKECNPQHPCPVHHPFKVIRDQLKIMLETSSIVGLASEIKSGLSHLKLNPINDTPI